MEFAEIARRFEISFIECGLDQVPQYEKLNQRLNELSDAVSEKEVKEKLAQQSRTEAEKVRLCVEQAVSGVKNLAQRQLCDAARRLEAAEIALAAQTKQLHCKNEEVIRRNFKDGCQDKASQATREHVYQLELNQRLVFAQLVWLASDRKSGLLAHLNGPSKSSKISVRSNPGCGRPTGTVNCSLGVTQVKPKSRPSENVCLCEDEQTIAQPMDQSKIIAQINELLNEKDEKIKQAKEKEFLLKQQILTLRNAKLSEDVTPSDGARTQKSKPKCLSDRLRRAELRLAKVLAETEKWQKCCDEKDSELAAERTHARDLQTTHKADMLVRNKFLQTVCQILASSLHSFDSHRIVTSDGPASAVIDVDSSRNRQMEVCEQKSLRPSGDLPEEPPINSNFNCSKDVPAVLSYTSQQRTPSMECRPLACPGEASGSSQAQVLSDGALRTGQQAELADDIPNDNFVSIQHQTTALQSQPTLEGHAKALTTSEANHLHGARSTRSVQTSGRPHCLTSRFPQRKQMHLNNSQTCKLLSNTKMEGQAYSNPKTLGYEEGRNKDEVDRRKPIFSEQAVQTDSKLRRTAKMMPGGDELTSRKARSGNLCTSYFFAPASDVSRALSSHSSAHSGPPTPPESIDCCTYSDQACMSSGFLSLCENQSLELSSTSRAETEPMTVTDDEPSCCCFHGCVHICHGHEKVGDS
ncbi:unnamed protein product [Schistocephalus solidus]|uniref:Uncharacterized protein n=1 Tax=Schistocephalus solidus TaxID=70667 RepID=A0A3P7CVZ7_SCHSO|nr:unnamed protein product [Schistocephalus solidus]